MAEKKEIRNSTAEFLIFQAEDKGQGIKVMYHDETVCQGVSYREKLGNCI